MSSLYPGDRVQYENPGHELDGRKGTVTNDPSPGFARHEVCIEFDANGEGGPVNKVVHGKYVGLINYGKGHEERNS